VELNEHKEEDNKIKTEIKWTWEYKGGKKGGAKEEHKREKMKGWRKLMEKGAMNHATWRMGYSKMSGEEPPLEVHTHSR